MPVTARCSISTRPEHDVAFSAGARGPAAHPARPIFGRAGFIFTPPRRSGYGMSWKRFFRFSTRDDAMIAIS